MLDSVRTSRFVLLAFTFSVTVLVSLVVGSGARAHTSLFAESFGTSASDVVPGWVETELSPPFGDTNDCGISITTPLSSSPTVGNAHLGNGCRLVRNFDTTGHENITLTFYCRGDTDAASNDRLQIAADLDGDGEIFEASLANFTVDEPGSDCPEDAWSSQYVFDLSAIDPVVNDSSFNLLITGQVIQVPDRDFRVDDVEVTGTDIGGPLPTDTPTTAGPTATMAAPDPTATATTPASGPQPTSTVQVAIALPATGTGSPSTGLSWLLLAALSALGASGVGLAIYARIRR